MVEFALVSPLFFLVLLGLIVAAIVVMSQMQLTNAARDAARAAAVCGSSAARRAEQTPTKQTGAQPVLPDGHLCTQANLLTYTVENFNAIGAATTGTKVCLGYSGSYSCTMTANALDTCQAGDIITVAVQYPQPLYVPFAGNLLGDPSTNTRLLQGIAQATCEQ